MLLFSKVSFYLSFLLFFLSFFSLYEGLIFYFEMKTLFLEWELFSIFGSLIIMTFLIDWMSLTFMGFVMLISSMVLFYGSSYMSAEKFVYRFNMLVFLFVVSMLLLIVSPNLISILLGWDGLGLVSYCLVIFYQNEKSANAGMLTILSNRVGDVAILLSIAWLSNFGSWNFFFLQMVETSISMNFILFMVILASMTKSAQIPFSAWLPAAMAAPTPVSSLVHSSTLVTAGIYLLIRFSHLLNLSSFLFVMGSLTMFMSGLGANFEMDLKKIIALSTLSQLGVMMMTLSLGFFELSFFHLLSHALFKSLLFLCAGVFIHGMGDNQDIRFLGGIHESCPSSSLFFIGCSLSLCGFPFLSGFYSKDVILECFFLSEMNIYMYMLILVGTLFTVTYSIRLGFYLYFKNLGMSKMMNLGEEKIMLFPMSVLFIFAMMGGSFMSWVFFPGYFIFLPLTFKGLVLCLSLLFMLLVILGLKIFELSMLAPLKKKYFFFSNMWFLPYFSSSFMVSFLNLGNFFLKFLDQGWVEYLGGQGFMKNVMKKSSFLDYFFLTSMKIYFLIFFILFIYFVLM
uniref:NADH-ubiquinone oxidoreductase chain 5 n=1 Tax=Homidia socia TaxID=301514 RepID=A0A6G6A5Y4_9HEXA|nr:NADH dehydrogenase subunit 5 [Homidia socia]